MINYFESILQLRNPKKDIQDFIEDYIKSSDKVFLSKRKKVKNGLDYYLSSNSFAVRLGRILKEKFGGELKVSEKLFSKDRQTSKELYRVNVLFRPYPMRLGDAISIDGKMMLVTSMGKKVYCLDLDTGKKEPVDLKEINPVVVEPENVTVSKVYPVIEVISPEHYESIPLVGAPKDLKIGEKVKVIAAGHKAYFLK